VVDVSKPREERVQERIGLHSVGHVFATRHIIIQYPFGRCEQRTDLTAHPGSADSVISECARDGIAQRRSDFNAIERTNPIHIYPSIDEDRN
jgi:hypothetical protein